MKFLQSLPKYYIKWCSTIHDVLAHNTRYPWGSLTHPLVVTNGWKRWVYKGQQIELMYKCWLSSHSCWNFLHDFCKIILKYFKDNSLIQSFLIFHTMLFSCFGRILNFSFYILLLFFFLKGNNLKTCSRSCRSSVQHAKKPEPTDDARSSFARHEQLIGRIQQLRRPSAGARQHSVGRRLVASIPSVHLLNLLHSSSVSRRYTDSHHGHPPVPPLQRMGRHFNNGFVFTIIIRSISTVLNFSTDTMPCQCTHVPPTLTFHGDWLCVAVVL